MIGSAAQPGPHVRLILSRTPSTEYQKLSIAGSSTVIDAPHLTT